MQSETGAGTGQITDIKIIRLFLMLPLLYLLCLNSVMLKDFCPDNLIGKQAVILPYFLAYPFCFGFWKQGVPHS